jgi:hypothetical protein
MSFDSELQMIVGDSGNPTTPTTLSPAWSTENTEDKYVMKRNQWYHLFMWVTGSSTSKTLNFRIGQLADTATATFYETGTTFTILESNPAGITVNQDDFLTTTKLYIGGYPVIGAFPVNPGWGGCGQMQNIVFMPQYTPLDVSDANILYNHMFEFSTNTPAKLHNYHFRIKNLLALDLINECDVPSLVQLNMQATDNTYSKKGIQFGYGDYYECVSSRMVPTEDLVVNFKFFFSQTPTDEFSIFSMLYKSSKNFISGSVPNGKLPVNYKLVKLGFFLDTDGKIKVYHMGLPKKLSTVFAVNTGYTVSISVKKYPDTFYTGPLGNRRLFIVYVDGVKTETFTLMGDFGVFYDVNQATLRNHYFYMGDYTTRSINRYNYAFLTPNPLNAFGPNSTERSFKTPILYLQDLIIYENATLTIEQTLLPTNCKIGVPGSGECIKCAANYALTSKFTCSLKSSLPTYTVFADNYDLTIECGDGLFFNTFLNFCQNCPTGCAICDSITSCSIKTTGCPSNCAQCDPSNVCTKCSTGYALNTGTNTCVQCQVSSGTNPCYSCDISDPLTCLQCYSSFFLNNGTLGCDPCSAVIKN